jgi:hypothetical protein
MGLTRPLESIKVDYSQIPEEVYISVFQSFLAEDAGLDTSRWMTGEILKPKMLNLPLRVPIWTKSYHPILFFVTGTTQWW